MPTVALTIVHSVILDARVLRLFQIDGYVAELNEADIGFVFQI